MATPTRQSYLAKASPAMKARLRDIASANPRSALIVATSTMLGNGVFDAIQEFNELLGSTGYHDYTKQKPGRAAHGVERIATYVYVENGNVVARDLDVVFYITPSRENARFNLVRKPAGLFSAEDLLFFIVGGNGDLVIVNVTRGLSSPDISPPNALWSDLLTAVADVAGSQGVAGSSIARAPILESASRTSSQGYSRDSAFTKAVETYAVDAAKSHYSKVGAVHEFGRPYDLRVDAPAGEIHIEVKGSSGEVDSVFVTKNEVSHARTTPDTELYVVDKIQMTFDAVEGWRGSGGRERQWKAWIPRDDQLTALVYSFSLNDPPD